MSLENLAKTTLAKLPEKLAGAAITGAWADELASHELASPGAMDHVLDALHNIDKASGKEKQRLLEAAMDLKGFQGICKAAYDPTVTYGLSECPKTPDASIMTRGKASWDDARVILGALATRNLTGNEARDKVASLWVALSPNEAVLLERVIARDLRCGINVSTINKAKPGLIPEFSPMLAHKYEPKRIKKWPQITQPKLDGVRVLAICNLDDRKVEFFSRTGKSFPAVEHLAEPLLTVLGDARGTLMANACDEADEHGVGGGDDMSSADMSAMDELMAEHGVDEIRHIVLDGEIVSGSFNKTVSEVRRSDEAALDAEFHIFDAIPAEEFYAGKSNATYRDRLKIVEAIGKAGDGTKIKTLPTYWVNSHAEIQTICTSVMARGLEGLIVKDPDAHYIGRRSYGWLKIKAEETEDLVVVGAFPGEPGTKYADCLGGLIVDRSGVQVRVGGGFSDDQRKSFWGAYQEDLRTLGSPPAGVGQLLGRMIEVEFHEVTPDGSLRHPRYKRFRDDKHGSF